MFLSSDKICCVGFLICSSDVSDSVGCFVGDSCVLPCTFKPGDDPLIHWFQMGGEEEIYAHSYYNGNDQLLHQKDRFRGRTSLFKDQIQRGNASLLLSRVEVQDQGRYKCYTSSINNYNELFIVVTVEGKHHYLLFCVYTVRGHLLQLGPLVFGQGQSFCLSAFINYHNDLK